MSMGSEDIAEEIMPYFSLHRLKIAIERKLIPEYCLQKCANYLPSTP